LQSFIDRMSRFLLKKFFWKIEHTATANSKKKKNFHLPSVRHTNILYSFSYSSLSPNMSFFPENMRVFGTSRQTRQSKTRRRIKIYQQKY